MKVSLVFILAIALFGLISFKNVKISVIESYQKHAVQSGGGQSGLTGAPDEANCTQCHVGTVNTDGTMNTLIIKDGITEVISYQPGQTYTVSLELSTSVVKKGFSSVALDVENNMAGDFAALSSTQKFNGGPRQYVSHKSSSNTAPLWEWEWTAPSMNVGDVTFYVAANETNSSGTNFGDQIHLSQHVIGSTSSIHEEKFNANFQAGYNNETNQLTVSFESLIANTMHLNLVDLSGKSVFTYTMDEAVIGENEETILLPPLKSGIYVVNFLVGNNGMSSKIVVQ